MATRVKGFFKGFKYISQIFVYKEHQMEIGYPTDVRYVAHIGCDSSIGSAPSWMNEFRTASDFSSSSLSNFGQSRETSWASQDFNPPRGFQPSSGVPIGYPSPEKSKRKKFRVGGLMGWTVPTDPNAMSYNRWAEKNRFQIGDSLLFVYPPDRDSVLQVTQDAYSTCNTSSYIQRFDDGNTVFTFNQSGPHYFISGNENNCLRNESMVVIVMANRSNRGSSGSNVAPATAPSPPPTAGLPLSPPSPPPSPEEVPPPPATEVTPSPSPAGESSPPPPPPNGASLKVVGFMGSVGALLGLLLFVF